MYICISFVCSDFIPNLKRASFVVEFRFLRSKRLPEFLPQIQQNLSPTSDPLHLVSREIETRWSVCVEREGRKEGGREGGRERGERERESTFESCMHIKLCRE